MHGNLRCVLQNATIRGRCFHTSTKLQRPVYELRTYKIQPAKFGDFLALTKEKIHMRTSHSPLLGYWTTELGGLNEVVHIWKYDSLAQRAAVRAALGQDKKWQQEYMAVMLPMLSSQENYLMLALDESAVKEVAGANTGVEPRMYVLEEKASSDKSHDSVGVWRKVAGPRTQHTVHLRPMGPVEQLVEKSQDERSVKLLAPLPFSPVWK
eukprot:Colp12_sorted_trinity150504_noHs@29999